MSEAIEPRAGLLVDLFTRVRSLLGVVAVVPYTFFWSLMVFSAGFLGITRLATDFMWAWASGFFLMFGLDVSTEGEENLPTEGGGIIVFNHQSHFDIPILMVTTRKHIRFGAKVELFRIPFFGAAMRAVGTLPIARDNRSEVMRIYKDAEKRFRSNTLFVLAPEGTRQHEPKLGRFKKGPFIFAVNAGVPLIPAVIKGAHAVLPKKSLWVNLGRLRRTVYVRYLPPIPTRGMSVENVAEFTEKTRAAMDAAFAAMPSD